MIRLKSLLFEVSLDQLKTQFVDTGKITDSEFTEIIDASGGKSAYATWLTKQVANKIIKPEDLYKYNAYFKIFDRRKREYPFQDINQYKTPQDISQFISKSVDIADREKADPSQQRGVAKTDRYAEFKIGEVAGFIVYKLPKGRKDLYGVSCELGSGTQWCTATGKTKNYFDKYISEGPLFIFIKPGSDEKYQFSYETNGFMDKNDNSVTNKPSDIISKFFDFIESQYSKYRMPFRVKIISYPDTLTKEDLNVKGDLDLASTKITSLPDGLRVGGNLTISSTKIESLPPDLKVVGNLYGAGTKIKSLPKTIHVGGSIVLYNTEITSLPDNLHINGSLDLNNNPIETLPTGLHVSGYLDLAGTRINSIPRGLRVGNFLALFRTPLAEKYSETEIRNMIEKSGGRVNEIRM
jgi:hypothetical protein